MRKICILLIMNSILLCGFAHAHAAQTAIDGLLNFANIRTQGLDPLCKQEKDKIRSTLSSFRELTKTSFSDAEIYYGELGTEQEFLLLDRINGYLEYITKGCAGV